MDASLKLAFLQLGLHMSFVRYAAQGEATVSCVALCRHADSAKDLLSRRIEDWLHPGITTVALCADALAIDEEAAAAAALIPDTVRWQFLTLRYAVHFFAEFVTHPGD